MSGIVLMPVSDCKRTCKSQPTPLIEACEQTWIDLNDCMSKSKLFCDPTHHAAVSSKDCGDEIDAFGDCSSADHSDFDAGAGEAGNSAADGGGAMPAPTPQARAPAQVAAAKPSRAGSAR